MKTTALKGIGGKLGKGQSPGAERAGTEAAKGGVIKRAGMLEAGEAACLALPGKLQADLTAFSTSSGGSLKSISETEGKDLS